MKEPVEHESDYELVQEVLSGVPEALDRFVQRMRCIPAILARKNQRLSIQFSKEELQDVAQDTFAVIWTKLGTFSGAGCLEAWAYRYCLNVLMNAQQKKKRRKLEQASMEPDETASTERALPFADRVAVHDALSVLEPEEADIIELKHFEGLTFEGIAKRKQIPSNSAKTRYYRALCKLEQKLGGQFREDAT